MTIPIDIKKNNALAFLFPIERKFSQCYASFSVSVFDSVSNSNMDVKVIKIKAKDILSPVHLLPAHRRRFRETQTNLQLVF